MKKPLLLEGMHGLGDNLHQRAAIRQLAAQGYEVWLETSWPCIYHDLPVHFVRKRTALRTQTKNVAREHDLFNQVPVPNDAEKRTVWYRVDEVRHEGSVLGAMLKNLGCVPTGADFRLPVPEAWVEQAGRVLGRADKPVMLYRPLVERTEWGGCAARNPDLDAYDRLYRAIRDRFYVVSVADLQPNIEWISSYPAHADVEFHAGELPFETLAALTRMASLVFASPGFAVPLAQAVGTPAVCVFGGYENSSSFSLGAWQAPYLGIDPINPCDCFKHDHACQKAIDLPLAIQTLRRFCDETATHNRT